MNTKLEKIFIGVLVLSLFNGCASHTTSQNTSVLDVDIVDDAKISDYNTVSILPFTVEKGVKITNSKFIENFSAEIYSRLRFDHSGVFQEVSLNNKKEVPGEVIVTGTIHEYEPGSATKRALLIGWGAAYFKGKIVIKDSQDGKILLSAPFDEQAWGGGYSRRTFQNLVTDAAIAISKTISQWKQGKISR